MCFKAVMVSEVLVVEIRKSTLFMEDGIKIDSKMLENRSLLQSVFTLLPHIVSYIPFELIVNLSCNRGFV